MLVRVKNIEAYMSYPVVAKRREGPATPDDRLVMMPAHDAPDLRVERDYRGTIRAGSQFDSVNM